MKRTIFESSKETQLSHRTKRMLKKYKVHFKNILEIGFNAGHSSELFLDTNPNSIVTNIDIGYWYYCKFGIKYLEKYPNRFQIILKDSIKALKILKQFLKASFLILYILTVTILMNMLTMIF